MTVIYLVRHGEYLNPKKIAPFRLPGVFLSNKGKKQAGDIADYLKNKKIISIYTSPIKRCRQTAGIISRVLKIKPNKSRLITETKSPLQGMDLDKFFNEVKDVFKYPPHLENNGESLEEVFLRAKKLIDKVLKQYQNKNVLLVSHGDTCMALIYGIGEGNLKTYFKKTRTYIPMGGLVKFEFSGDKLKDFKEVNY